MDNEIKEKKVIYSWRVIAMLNYLRAMLCDKDVERDDFRKVIDNYITFTEETVDSCKREESTWTNIDYHHGYPYSCTCGKCGYKSIIGKTNFCPDCGRVMDMKFTNYKVRKMYECLVSSEYKHKED